MRRILCTLLCGLISYNAYSIEEDAPPPPEVTEEQGRVAEAEARAQLKPEVTIIKRKKELVEEYRLHGKLYMVKVNPTIGRSYYMIDHDGDGVLETTDHELDHSAFVPQWILLSW